MNIVVLTGSGISAESGIPTFRASDGLWENHRIEDVATPEGFKSNPTLVHDFYNQRRRKLLSPDIAPNAAHFALAELEANCSGNFLIATQNVDNLHERSGSKAVRHIHGELLNMRCEFCNNVSEILADANVSSVCPLCWQAGRMRPDIVWFGEMPMHLPEVYAALSCADVFLAIGTSGKVYPAAGFVREVPRSCLTIEVNLEPSEQHSFFKRHVRGKASEVLPSLAREFWELVAP